MYAVFGIFAAVLFGSELYQRRVCGVCSCQALRMLSLFIAVSLVGGLYCGKELDRSDPLTLRNGEVVCVKGMVTSIQSGDYYKLTVKIDGRDPGDGYGGSNVLVRVYKGDLDAKMLTGAKVTINGEVSLPTAQRNPGCFDYRAYLRTIRVWVVLSCDSNNIIVNESNAYSLSGIFLNKLALLKYSLLERVSAAADDDTAAMLAGMLFGDKSGLDEDVYESFQKNGTAHILSVSGIHVAIVYAFIMKLLGGRKGPSTAAVSAVGLFIYAALAQFAPSVIRASLMILTHIAAMLLRRRYDLLTGACASAGVMLLANPLQLFNMGFQLSFLAIFAMAFAIPFLDRYLVPLKSSRIKLRRGKQEMSFDTLKEGGVQEIIRKLLRGILPLVVIQGGMAPYTAYAFNYFSAAAFFINIPVIALAGLIIPIGTVLMLLMRINDTLFDLGASAVENLTWVMTVLNDAGYRLAWGHTAVVSPPETWLLLYYMLFFIVSSESFRIIWQRKNKKYISVTAAILVCGLFLAWCAPGSGWDKSSLVFVDVGQGDCLHIRTPDGKNILIDSGGSATYSVGEKLLLPYLLKNGVSKLDLVLITHLHTDHFQGVVELSQYMKIDKLALYEGNCLLEDEISAKLAMSSEKLMYVYAGERLILSDGVYTDILFPERCSKEEYERVILTEEDENKSSLLMKLNYHGISVLMTGDLGFEGEDALLAAYAGDEDFLRASILKVGHHGSRYSTGNIFLETISPIVAVFQVGKNTFGHPHPTVLEKMKSAGVEIYRNDISGAIMFIIDEGGGCVIRTMLD